MMPLACKQSKARAMSRAKDKATGRSRRWGRMLVRYLRSDIPGSNSVTITIKGSLHAPINLTRLWCLTRDIIFTSRMKRLWREDLSSGLLPRWRTLIATIREPYLEQQEMRGEEDERRGSIKQKPKKKEKKKTQTFLDRLCRERLRQSWSRWTTTLDPLTNSPLSSIPSLPHYSFSLSLFISLPLTLIPCTETPPSTQSNFLRRRQRMFFLCLSCL